MQNLSTAPWLRALDSGSQSFGLSSFPAATYPKEAAQPVRSAYSSLMDDDAADFAVRSPFPTIHLLRERDVMAALKAYPDAEGIPQRNAARLRDQGAEACARRLEAVYEVS